MNAKQLRDFLETERERSNPPPHLNQPSSQMHPPSTPTPLTVGKLLARTIGLYRAHGGIFLRTAAIFYLPVAALSFFFIENLSTSILFALVVWPVDAIVSMSLIAHCIDSLHGRPLALSTAVMRGLRRLPAYIGIAVAMTVVFSGVVLVLAAPIWVGLLNSGTSLAEIFDAFPPPAGPGDIEKIIDLLDAVLWGATGVCLPGVLMPIVLFYLLARWRIAEVALMAEGTGPLQSLRRSWNLSRDFVLRTIGYLLLIAFVLGLVGGVLGMAVDSAADALVPAVDQSRMFGINFAFSKLLSIIVTPFYVSAIVLYYFDLRVRKERYDFEVVQ